MRKRNIVFFEDTAMNYRGFFDTVIEVTFGMESFLSIDQNFNRLPFKVFWGEKGPQPLTHVGTNNQRVKLHKHLTLTQEVLVVETQQTKL